MIQPKPKKQKEIFCKPIGKAFGFEPEEPCAKKMTEFEKRTYGMCSACLWDFYHNDERGKILYQKLFLPKVAVKIKVNQRIEKNKSKLSEKIVKNELKENTTNPKTTLQKHVNTICRLIDKDLLCLARNQKGKMDAGHVFARGGNQTIRYNLHNIHRQSAQSNHFQNDDGLLREGIVNEYGADYMDFIASLRRTPQLTYKEWEYKELSLTASKIALRLKKLDLCYSLNERIELRNKINIELGIYENEFCVFNLNK